MLQETEVERLLVDNQHVIGRLGSHLLVVHRGPVSTFVVKQIRRFALSTAQKSPLGMAYVARVYPETGVLPAEIRDEFANIGRELNGLAACLSATFEGNGFFVAAQRAIFTGLLLASKVKYPTKATANVVDAANWVSAQLKGKDTFVSSAMLHAALVSLSPDESR